MVSTLFACLAWLAEGGRVESSTTVAPVASASVRLVSRATPGTVNEMATLPASQTEFDLGDTVFIELWAQTPEADGFAQVSADLQFDPSVLEAVGVTPTALFNFAPSGTIDNGVGLVDNLSGAHPPAAPACSDQVGAAPKWARVAVVEMKVIGGGRTSLLLAPADDGLHFVAICGQLQEPTVDFLGADLTIAPLVPAVSELGLLLMGAVFVLAAARQLRRRRSIYGDSRL